MLFLNIKLSCNYVSELRELINEGKIDIDYVKFPAINDDMTKLEEALEVKSVMFHGFPPYNYFLNLGSSDMKSVPFDELNEVIIRTRTPHISGHMNTIKNNYLNYDGSIKYKNKVQNAMIENIIFIMNNISVPFLGENVFANNNSNKIDTCAEPEFISNVINETGCGFLFDITHAMISAQNLDLSFTDYINKLPMDKTYEIHLSGSKIVDGRLVDIHGNLNDEYYEILEYLLKNTPAKYVTFEYQTQTYDFVNPQYKNDLYEQLVRLKEVISKF